MKDALKKGQYVVFNNELCIFMGEHPTMNGCYVVESQKSGDRVPAHNLAVKVHLSVAGNIHFSERHKTGGYKHSRMGG